MKHDKVETNLKLIKDGKNLQLSVRVIRLSGGEFDVDDIQKVCSLLSYQRKISATPYSISSSPSILINRQEKIDNCSVKLKKGTLSFNVIFQDKAEFLTLDFQIEAHRHALADLYKKAFLIAIARTNKYWTFDSPRIFYSKEPFKKGERNSYNDSSDISVFRRFEISEVILDDGIALSVDVGTAFFTNQPVEFYFKNNAEKKFRKLTSRQDEQKGTLLYKSPRGMYSKCYFVKYEHKVTCGTSHSFEYDGTRYLNLFDYYQKINSKYLISEKDNIAYVSFPGLDGQQPVAANKLYIRVMNDMLPYELSKLDKISPKDRVILLDQFWAEFGKLPFGENFQGLEFVGKNYLPFEKAGTLTIPPLTFNGKNILHSPHEKSQRSYKENFRNRKDHLIEHGCFFTPLTITREIHFVYPEAMSISIAEDFANDVCDLVSSLTKVNIEPVVESYSDYKAMINSLNQEPSSMVVFIFNKMEPATYFTISHELKDWSIKRVTSQQIVKKHENKVTKKGSWNSFIELNTFDILQQLGVVPWICPPLHYDIHLAIDVSEKFTHFCFSFYMYNSGMQKPIIKTDTFTKSNRKEKINQTILESKLNNLFDGWSNDLINSRPLRMLVTRDGKVCEGESEAIDSAVKNQISKKNLSNDFTFDVIEYHKTSLKGIRLWMRNESVGLVENVLEGTFFLMNSTNAILSPTGSSTLNQGTAHPILIRKIKGTTDMKVILQDVFALTQLNFSSPTVAQGHCLPIKRADEQLKDRKMQEVERIK
jgi:hypothetical protein